MVLWANPRLAAAVAVGVCTVAAWQMLEGSHAKEAPSIFTPALGGDTTRAVVGKTAFTHPAANMQQENQRAFFFGNRLFNTNWVTSPASVKSFDGLGPLFNRVSCDGCHTQDGRGRPPLTDAETMDSMLIRISMPDPSSPNGSSSHPVYGDQLSERSIPGVPPEGKTKITRVIIKGTYGDGSPYELEKPSYRIGNLGYGQLGDKVLLSARVAPQIIGLGLLEAIPEETLLGMADPDDTNSDGISGRVNKVVDPVSGTLIIGRFGWKANQANLASQNAGAAIGDIGITSPIHPVENCTEAQKECLDAPLGGEESDMSQSFLDRLTLYTRLLAVPAQRKGDDAGVKAGAALFAQFGCSTCHAMTLQTGTETSLPELSNQTFHPFTDLLLHDMGPDLADNRPDGLASGSEWRTPPLWGIGLFQLTNGHQRLLHDGRARGVAEAILWHGGEAEKAREAFRFAGAEDRQALIAFVNSL